MIYPKIELHVHIEGAMRPSTVLAIASRNGVDLPVSSEADLERLFAFKDFGHFLDMYRLGVRALRTANDFGEITVAYAQEAASHGAVYVEAIFSAAGGFVVGRGDRGSRSSAGAGGGGDWALLPECW